MKKINFKSLLIIVLALVLVIGLVACDKKKDDNSKPPKDPGKDYSDVKAYFNNLWELSSEIGGDQINSGDSIGVSLDLGVELGTVKRNSTDKVHTMQLGFGVQAVLDRKSANSANSALKVNLYSGATQICTLYYFMNDNEKLYVDFSGQHVVVNAKFTDPEGTDTLNTVLGTALHNALGNTSLTLSATTYTINQLIDAFTAGTGDGWNLNTLLLRAISLFGISEKQINDLVGNSIFQSILGTDIKDANGNLDLAKVLGGETFAQLFGVSQSTNAAGTTIHTATLQVVQLNSIMGMINGAMPNLDKLISGNTIKLEYGETSDKKLDGFAIDIALNNQFWTISPDKDKNTRWQPYVRVSINDLEISNQSTPTGLVTTAVEKSNYSTQLAINNIEAIKVSGFDVTLDKGDETKEHNIPVEGVIELGIKGVLDLTGSNNNTKLNAYLAYYNDASATKTVAAAGDHFVDLTYANSTLGLQINREVHIDSTLAQETVQHSIVDNLIDVAGKPLFDLLKKAFKNDPSGIEQFENAFFAKADGEAIDYKHVSETFKGAVWTGLNLYDAINDALGNNVVYSRYKGTYNSEDSKTVFTIGGNGNYGPATYTVKATEKDGKDIVVNGTYSYDKDKNLPGRESKGHFEGTATYKEGEKDVTKNYAFDFELDRSTRKFTVVGSVTITDVPAEDSGSSAEDAPKPKIDYISYVKNALVEAFKVLSTEEGKVVIKTNNVLQTVCDFANRFIKDGEKAWTVDGCVDEMVKAINGALETMSDATKLAAEIDKVVAALPDSVKKMVTNEMKEQVKTAITTNITRIKGGITVAASALTIDGVAAYDSTADGADPVRYLIEALLKNTGAQITLDATKGLSVSVKVTVGEASIEVSMSLGLISVDDAGLIDVGETYRAAVESSETTGWVVYEF